MINQQLVCVLKTSCDGFCCSCEVAETITPLHATAVFLPSIVELHEVYLSHLSLTRTLNGFLNTGRGGTVYLGVLNDGVVKGLTLTQHQVKSGVVIATGTVCFSGVGVNYACGCTLIRHSRRC